MGVSGGPYVIRDSSLVLELDVSDRNSYTSGSTTWKDLSGNNNSGSFYGTPGYDNSNGGGFNFNNAVSNSGILYGNPASLSFPQNALSLEAWFKLSASTFLFNKDVASYGGFNLWYTGTLFRFQIYSGSTAPAPINLLVAYTININSCYHLCSTYDGTVANTYVNGTLLGTQTNSSTIVNTTGSLTLGYRDNGVNVNFGSGSIYAAKIYNRALSQVEVQQNYNALKSRFGLT
jgi:hypothetical protein